MCELQNLTKSNKLLKVCRCVAFKKTKKAENVKFSASLVSVAGPETITTEWEFCLFSNEILLKNSKKSLKNSYNIKFE